MATLSGSFRVRFLRFLWNCNPDNFYSIPPAPGVRLNRSAVTVGRSPARPFSVISNMEQPIGVATGTLPINAGISTTPDVGDDGRMAVQFPLSQSTVLVIQKGDITRWSVDGSTDAIVNPANELMLGGGGADGAIHRAAGPELQAACYKYPLVRTGCRCPTGEARITPGFKLPASHVIHTVGPIYDSDSNPEASLSNAYRNSLRVAKENNIQYVAFPAISCGVFRYPYDEAATVAIASVRESADSMKEIHFVLFSDDIYKVWVTKAKELLQN